MRLFRNACKCPKVSRLGQRPCERHAAAVHASTSCRRAMLPQAASTLRRAAAGQAKRHSPRLALIPAKQPAAAAGPGRPPTLRQKRSRDSEQRECLLCGSGTMRGKQWCRHPETKAEWLCHPCYGKERIRLTKRQREEQQRLDEQQRRQAAAQGLLRTCLECGTFKCGYQWSRHPVTKAEWLCSKCVGKAWCELRRQEKQEEKRQKQQAEQLAEESASPPPKRRKVADAAAAAGTQEREQHSQPDAGLQTLADAAAEALAQALGMRQAAAPQAVAARQEAAPQRPTRSSSQQHSTRRRAAPQGAALQRETRRSSTQHGTQRRAAPQGAALQRKTRRGSQQHSTQLGAAPQEAAAQRKTRRGSKLNPTVP